MSHVHVSAGVPGYRSPPFMEDQPPPGRGVVIAKRLSQMQKVRGSNPAPASHRAAAGQRSSHIAKPATPEHQQSPCGTRAGKTEAKSAQMSDLGCFWPSTGVAASAAAASHVNGHSQANHAQKHQRRSMPDMGGASEAKTWLSDLAFWPGRGNGVGRDSRPWNWPYPSCRSKIISESWPWEREPSTIWRWIDNTIWCIEWNDTVSEPKYK